MLQERGGDLACWFGPDSCADSRRAIEAIVALAKREGVKAYLIGTYQGDATSSETLIASESAAAAEAGIPYLEVSRKLQTLRSAFPGMDWLASDGMHPGPSLVLLNATVLYQALLGKLPEPSAITVDAPDYGSTSSLTAVLRRADDPLPLTKTPHKIKYSAESLVRVLQSLGTGSGK